jgi:hypothetical protein
VEETTVYRAAFEAAKEAGADDETAKEAAEQAIAEANSGGVASDKDRKDRASEGKTREDTPSDEDVTASDVEDGSSDSPSSESGDTMTGSPDSRTPLLLGGAAFLSVGGFAALRFARSWSSSEFTRLPRN